MFMMGIIVNIMKNKDKDLDFEYKKVGTIVLQEEMMNKAHVKETMDV